jgi:hypothetical protein
MNEPPGKYARENMYRDGANSGIGKETALGLALGQRLLAIQAADECVDVRTGAKT